MSVKSTSNRQGKVLTRFGRQTYTTMVAEWSTAVSDACLALSAFHGSQKVSGASYLASVGFGMIGAAASCGALRFSKARPAYGIVSWHKYLSWLAGVSGLPMVAAGYGRQANIPALTNAFIAASIAILLLQKTLGKKVIAMCGDILGAVSMIAIFVVSIPKTNFFGILGGALYLVGSILFKAEMSMGPIKPVDAFHYSLMLGNIALLLGLTKEPVPIYYRKST